MKDVTGDEEQRFAMMRFQMLAAALTPGPRERLSDAYVFAWDELVYPFFDDGTAWHRPFADHFVITSDMLDELSKFLDDRWLAKDVPSFYELERRYDVRGGTTPWDRAKLIDACRYMFLHDSFDAEFWAAILTPTDHPAEAGSIRSAYNRDEDLYFH